MSLFVLILPVKWRAQGTCESPLVWLLKLSFCKNQKHCQAVCLDSERWEWEMIPKVQMVGSGKMGTAIKPRGWAWGENRKWGTWNSPGQWLGVADFGHDGIRSMSHWDWLCPGGLLGLAFLRGDRWRQPMAKGLVGPSCWLQLRRNLTLSEDTTEPVGWNSFSRNETVLVKDVLGAGVLMSFTDEKEKWLKILPFGVGSLQAN